LVAVVLPVVESSAASGRFDGLATLDEDAVYQTYAGVAGSGKSKGSREI